MTTRDVRAYMALLAGSLLASTLLIGGCDAADRVPVRTDATDATLDTVDLPEDIYIAAETDPAATAPATIYHDLMRFEWYARGEPLVHDGRAYSPARVLVTAATALRPLGEHGGVSYYASDANTRDTLYVPVHERYWLPFVRDERPPDGATPAR